MQKYISNNYGNKAGTSGGISDPRCRMVEHIVAQYGSNANYVRDILNEKKAGAPRQPVLFNMIKTVISKY
jgi:hypothetical protein